MPPDMECTFWPDGWPVWLGGTGQEWHHCCVAHDLGASNLDLARCVAETSPTMAAVMFAGLVVFGPIYLFWRRIRCPRGR